MYHNRAVDQRPRAYSTPGAQISVNDGGKRIHCVLRWGNTTGENGPWSEAASATIGA